MNRKYAIEILEMVERKTCEFNCSLAIEAYDYLEKLKSTNEDLFNRIYNARHKK